MHFCLRIDLDYVPWDSYDAADFGHGEPAMLLRLLAMARAQGLKFHVFASERVIKSFPTAIDAILGDSHDLDWLCKKPDEFEQRFINATEGFLAHAHEIKGVAIRDEIPKETAFLEHSSLEFITSLSKKVELSGLHGMTHFPVETGALREGIRGGQTLKSWSESVRLHLRAAASLNKHVIVVVRPQVLAKYDPELKVLSEIIKFSNAMDFKNRTLRETLDEIKTQK